MSRTRGRAESGSAAVEFALVVTPLLMIVFGIMQYAFYFYSMQGGADAARQAARLASIGTPGACPAFTTAVKNTLSVAGASGVTVTRTYTKGAGNVATTRQIGDAVAVTVSFQSTDFHLPWTPLPNGGQVVSTAQARVDYAPDPTIAAC